MDTFYAIIQLIMALTPQEIDGICGDGGLLNDKLALTLSKYVFKAYDLIQDKEKSSKILSIVQNGQPLLKLQLKITEKMGNVSILKYQFEKHEIL